MKKDPVLSERPIFGFCSQSNPWFLARTGAATCVHRDLMFLMGGMSTDSISVRVNDERIRFFVFTLLTRIVIGMCLALSMLTLSS
jgi:hypothetical protein